MLGKIFSKTPKIEFVCHKEDYGIIPQPYPARKLMPEWYKKLPMKLGNQGLESSTIKRCPPFLDAMQIGWIIPLAADVEIISNDDASGINYKWSFYKPMIENHMMKQIYPNDEKLNPNFPKPPMKFLNWWAIKITKGWSVLFVPPINRPDPRFECISGLVDCDGYFEFVNFPFLWKAPNWSGIIESGTPLVQAIPIKRDNILKEFGVRHMDDVDVKQLEITRKRVKTHESHYRDNVWSKK